MEKGAGDDGISTYDTGFLGVELPSLPSLPRMLETEKEQVMGKNKSGSKPAAWSRAGVPLLWQESKILGTSYCSCCFSDSRRTFVLMMFLILMPGPNQKTASKCIGLHQRRLRSQSLWEAVLSMTNAKCIIDLSSGSGCLAKVAMKQNLPYLGITKNKAHMAFLNNVIDMYAIKCLSQSTHPLYQQNLRDLLAEHFSEEVKRVDGEDDLSPEELLALQKDVSP